MSSRKTAGRPPRATNKPKTGNSKKAAAPLRQLPGAAVEKTDRMPGAHLEAGVATLVRDIGTMIDAARRQVSVTANAALVTLYWQIGHRVRTEVLEGQRAEYGVQLVPTVGKQLEAQYGRGFGEKNLRRMVQFSAVFPNVEIVAALLRELGWTHFTMLIPLKDPLKREFYAEMCRAERWSTRDLRQQLDGMLFERTALSKKPEALIRKELSALREKGELSPALVFRDPYMLDFLELADTYSEKDLESAILREIERFLLELGAGFAFVERQKRITLDGDDYYLDLLFFHRRMQRLVAIELKIGDFKPADSGQMELYLRWLDHHERQPSEQPPLGIILCAGKKRETVEYLDLDTRGIHVAEYLTELPPREVLEERLHRAIEAARNRLVLEAGIDAAIDIAPTRGATPKRKRHKK
ncbi:PDDEXK nuclease domain-containing protein [Archangium violaceum]|uniref:PDDEXK nuclease domain-containing protein n=1 Tax=Archangium violaceum TaxID=83451 RepID=UPI0007C716D2|nr:PDDEXK nuclease domain-containing protein [Archangium violaceum]